jgi:hypothetical protein
MGGRGGWAVVDIARPSGSRPAHAMTLVREFPLRHHEMVGLMM